jgi:hypothetical protein
VALNKAFEPQGLTITLTTNAVGGTSNSVLINSAALGVKFKPTQFRLINVGTDYVWVSFTQTAAGIVVPTAGTGGGSNATVGTPQQAIRLVPLVVEVFTFSQYNPNPTSGQGDGFYLNNISATAGQVFDVTAGEGV